MTEDLEENKAEKKVGCDVKLPNELRRISQEQLETMLAQGVTEFSDFDFSGMRIGLPKGNRGFLSVSVKSSDLSNAIINAKDNKAKNCLMNSATFNKSCWIRAKNCSLENAIIHGTIYKASGLTFGLENCSLVNAKVEGYNIDGKFRGVDFSGAKLSNVILGYYNENYEGKQCRYEVTISDCRFLGTNFSQSDFQYVEIEEGNDLISS